MHLSQVADDRGEILLVDIPDGREGYPELFQFIRGIGMTDAFAVKPYAVTGLHA